MKIPAKVQSRLVDGIKKFKPILKKAYLKDINESDTVLIVHDILSTIFGYDRFSEITSEYAINSNYCDLAIKMNNKICFLIEVKAIGIELNSNHISQAVNYGANKGVDWVILTNGINWKVFNIMFKKPICHDLVYEFNITELSTRLINDIELLYLVSKESLGKSALSEFHERKQALSKYFIGNLIIHEQVVDILRKQLKKFNPELKIDNDIIVDVLINEVLKRDALDGEKSDAAKRKIKNYFNRIQREKRLIAKPAIQESNNILK